MTEKLAELFEEHAAADAAAAAQAQRLSDRPPAHRRRGPRPAKPRCRLRSRPSSRRRSRRCAAAAAGCRRAGRDRGPRPAARRLRHPRSVAPSVRLAGIPRRAGADLAVQAIRRPFGDPRRARRRAFHRPQRQGPLVPRPHRLRGHAAGRHRGCRDRADPRARWPAARGARLVRHRVARRGRRHALCGDRAASTRSCASTTARTGCWRAASRSRCRRRCAHCPPTRASRAWCSCRRASRSPAR